jgi:hypothetical protein
MILQQRRAWRTLQRAWHSAQKDPEASAHRDTGLSESFHVIFCQVVHFVYLFIELVLKLPGRLHHGCFHDLIHRLPHASWQAINNLSVLQPMLPATRAKDCATLQRCLPNRYSHRSTFKF